MNEFKLFVGNLPSDISEEDMRTVFSTYGLVTDVHIMTGRSQSGAACAFVHYQDQISADSAIAALNKAYKIRIDAVDPITVSYAKADNRQSGAYTFNPLMNPAFGAGMYPQMSAYDASVYNMYAQAMAGAGVHPAHAASPMAPMGQEFLNPMTSVLYNPMNQAMAASVAAAMGLGGAPGAGLGAGDWASSQMGRGFGNKSPGHFVAGGKVRNGRNPHPNHPGKIFVGNLPTDITKDVLRQVFSTYGVVTDVHVMVGKSDSGQACAFVEYQTQLEAQTAINTLNNNYEIREGCGKIVCRFYEKPDNYLGSGRKFGGSPDERKFGADSAQRGQGFADSKTGDREVKGKGKGLKQKFAGSELQKTNEFHLSSMHDSSMDGKSPSLPILQQSHAAFLQIDSNSPALNKTTTTGGVENLSTPQNATLRQDGETAEPRKVRGLTVLPNKEGTKSTTASPGDDGVSAGSPTQMAVVA